MNILWVPVTERPREIATRRATGAKARHILLQFLVEATTLSMAGGVVGALLGIGSGKAISFFADWPTFVSPSAVLGSVVFSRAARVFFGFYPARQASLLEAILAFC